MIDIIIEVLISVIALVVTLGILVTIHEFGHFWVARQCGVKVLTFSIGFGRSGSYFWNVIILSKLLAKALETLVLGVLYEIPFQCRREPTKHQRFCTVVGKP